MTSWTWRSWTKGAPAFLQTLAQLTPDDVVWVRTAATEDWTLLSTAQQDGPPVAGPPGADGLHCWDLNGNGVFDAGTGSRTRWTVRARPGR